MDLKDIVAISGMGGLFEMKAQRSNGMIVSRIGEDKKVFVSDRNHFFTPLENITIYTENEEGKELAEVFRIMKEKENDQPVPDPKTSDNELADYFALIVPDYDREKVYKSDMRKMVKWYRILDEAGLVDTKRPESENEPAPDKE